MGIEKGKEVTAAIDDILTRAKTAGKEPFWGDDGSRQLLVDNAAGLAGLNVDQYVKKLSAPTAYILTAALISEPAKMRVQAYHRPEQPGTQTGYAWLGLSGAKTRTGLEVIVENADSPEPTVFAGLPRDLLVREGDVFYFSLHKLMQARPPEVQVRDALGIVTLAGLALGLATEKK